MDAQTTFGPFVLLHGRELLRDGAPVAIGQRALMVLDGLVGAEGGVVTKAELMARAWPGVIVEEGNLTVQVATLRKELGTRPDGQDWIVTIPRIGYRFAGLDPARPAPAAPVLTGESGKPRLAVLPFANLSGDQSRDYFADGVVEDLITALSRFKSFAVTSRNSTFAYKGKAMDVRQVARELDVRYLLEGSVRLVGDRVRVTTQLVHAQSGTHNWAQSFDGELGQIFEFQDRITEAVVGLVEPQIRKAEIERARRQWPADPQAYDYFLRALPFFYSRDPQGYRTALEYLEQAIALEPDYAAALAYASWADARRGTVSLKMLTDDESVRCLEYARRALLYGEDDPVVLAICAHTLLAIGHLPAEGLAAARRALDANPNNVSVQILAGICNMLAGDLDQAEACGRRAFQLSPGAPEAYEGLAITGFSLFLKGEDAAAVEWLEKSRSAFVDWPPTMWMLTAAYAHLGRMDDAARTLRRLLELAPYTTLEGIGTIRARGDARLDRLLDGLRMAGLT
jgi:TolB-like protein/Flp pilus assembly protein TadD